MVAPTTPTLTTEPTIVDAIKSAAWTSLWTLVGLLGPLALNWLQAVSKWASTSGRTPLPGLSTLGYAVVAAVGAVFAGFVALVVRTLQTQFSWMPGTAPKFGVTASAVPPIVLSASQADLDAIHHDPPNAVQALVDTIAAKKQAIADAEAELASLRAALAVPPEG